MAQDRYDFDAVIRATREVHVMDEREAKIRERAQKIWEDEGRPEGSHEEHWRRAEEEHEASEQANTDEGKENWKVEAGLPDDKAAPSIMPTVIPPD
jgi:hypothetical protein